MLECINVLELERPISFYSLDIKGSIVRSYMQNTFVLSLHCGVSLIVSVASIDTLFLVEKVVLIFVECIRFSIATFGGVFLRLVLFVLFGVNLRVNFRFASLSSLRIWQTLRPRTTLKGSWKE